MLVWLERYAEARRLVERVVEHARAVSSPGMLPYALASLADLDYRTGRWASAYAAATEALRLADETGPAAGLTFSLVTLGRLEAAQGREADCRAHIARALEFAAFGLTAMVGYASAALGFLELGYGRLESAIRHLDQVARAMERQGVGEPAGRAVGRPT